VDESEDFTLADRIYEELYREGDPPFSFEDILRILVERPELVELNREFVGKEKYRDLWNSGAARDEHAEEES
jgi:spore coat polysaccharide biosynthesis protein SpsF (cytidylyltransferase family)